jgi:lipopolysaccharide export system permease protein
VPKLAELSLTPEGRRIIRQTKDGGDIYVITDVSFDQLYNRNRNYRYVSTQELIRRINNPAFGSVSVRGQAIHLHARLVRPLINIIAVFLTVPLLVRKESRSLVGNMAACSLVMSAIYGFAQLLTYMAGANLIAADMSAWAPAIVSGALCAWLSPFTQT